MTTEQQNIKFIERPFHIHREAITWSGQTTIYCGVDMRDAAPFVLPINAVIELQTKVPICKACWDIATKHIHFYQPVEAQG